MAFHNNPRIITDGLVLCLDAHDAKSYAGEPTTNLLLYPESINSGPTQESWSGTITQNAVIAPDGTLTATKIEATSGYVYERKDINTNYNGVSFGVGDTITYSVWIKMLDGTQTASYGPYIWNYNSPTYGIVARDLSGLGPDWKLYKMTYTIQSHQTSFSISYSASNGGVTGTFAIWHPQLEVKSYNTPYVETSRSVTDAWVDRSGNSSHGDFYNGLGTGVSHYRDGQVIMPVANSYLEFDSNTIIIDDVSNISLTSGSVEAWVKMDSISSNKVIVAYGGNGTNTGWLLQNESNTSNKIGFSVLGAANAYSGNTLSTGYLNNWTHFVGTYGGGAVKFYANGALVASTATSTNVSSSSTLRIGNESNRSYFLDGQLGLVRIYNKTLTAAEVLSNYNATKGRYS